MNKIEYKLGGSVRDVDATKRIVTGYFTNSGSLDSDKDIFEEGAFRKTIKEHGPQGKNRIWHLWMHDSLQPINKPNVLKETKDGVYFETRMIDTPISLLALQLYVEGAISEHSVGFETLKWDDDEQKNIRTIKEVKMWEGSTVLWGANENTPFAGLKSEQEIQYRVGVLEKLLRTANFEKDEVYELIIQEIERLKSISTLEPARPLKPSPQESLASKLTVKLNLLKQ